MKHNNYTHDPDKYDSNCSCKYCQLLEDKMKMDEKDNISKEVMDFEDERLIAKQKSDELLESILKTHQTINEASSLDEERIELERDKLNLLQKIDQKLEFLGDIALELQKTRILKEKAFILLELECNSEEK